MRAVQGHLLAATVETPGAAACASGYVGDAHRPTFAIRPGASGDITPRGDFTDSEFIAWYQGKSAPYNPSQIVYGNYLYTLYDQGFLTCHNATTGEELFGKQRFSPRGSFTASPFAYNGHLFFLSEDGLTHVMKAGSKFEIVGRELQWCVAQLSRSDQSDSAGSVGQLNGYICTLVSPAVANVWSVARC